MFTKTFTALSLSLALAAAQNDVVQIFLPSINEQGLSASIAGGDATATTYVVQCTSSAGESPCAITAPFTVTEGPSTLYWVQDVSNYIITYDCKLAIPTSASCIFTQPNGGATTISTVTYTGNNLPFVPVTVTAGAVVTGTASTSGSVSASTTATDSASASASASASESSASGSAASASASGSSASSTSSESATSSTSSTSSTSASGSATDSTSTSGSTSGSAVTANASGSATSTATSAAGVSQITAKAQWIMGGAAAALAVAAF
ncbi:hypothetical protein MMC25_004852 [Agyrium rufum]|nr:hypothetical protein [Agyrium rufum]